MKPPRLHHENLQWLLNQPTDIKLSMLENHLDICRLLVNEILEEEVRDLCGERYAHQKPHNGRYARYGYNTGSVRIGEHWLSVSVPRVIDQETKTMKSLESYARLKTSRWMRNTFCAALCWGCRYGTLPNSTAIPMPEH
jgi:hypothetical protein